MHQSINTLFIPHQKATFTQVPHFPTAHQINSVKTGIITAWPVLRHFATDSAS